MTADTARSRPFAVIILAAGKGTRMRSDIPKVLHKIAGKTVLGHAASAPQALDPAHLVIVVGPGMEHVVEGVPGAIAAIQTERLGTAHAVLAARDALAGFDGNLMILNGDVPLIRTDTLRDLQHGLDGGAAVSVLGFECSGPHAYGRLIVDEAGALDRIVENKDATAAEKTATLCNSNAIFMDGAHAWDILSAIDNDNAQGEYYLPDVVKVARARGLACSFAVAPEDEVHGINSRSELARAEGLLQARLRARAMDEGATLIAPDTVFFSHDTQLGRDVVVEPHVVFGPGAVVEDGATIKAFSHVEGARVATGASVGPFARLRPGADIGSGAKIGNFVEVKKATIEAGAKVSHLSYIGDARIGENANVGAGTITCNYDGYDKHFTDIGAGAFIGSNTSLVAPVIIGDGGFTGSGSVITKDVSADALAVERAPQKEVPGWAAKFRARKEKAKKKGA
ncbi:bifunctional UDP-N-acetylglucosamine diphosphorylase/glucosamine-1-phosphate N-acetyltransferase GlmU [Pyruvatibacter sp.]|uniref:bifunctional UDP-N-acetylglucosamine diphosphorylase/glucosamine-1-phosphate N-acetyltransferase GlmU n=1 Tax=Pyruvatibacter sp. TaxID=1981328 RepID=UPI0032EDD18B